MLGADSITVSSEVIGENTATNLTAPPKVEIESENVDRSLITGNFTNSPTENITKKTEADDQKVENLNEQDHTESNSPYESILVDISKGYPLRPTSH